MNTIYRIVFNASTGKWVVASELAKGRKKASRLKVLASAVVMSVGGMAGLASAADTCKTAEGLSGTADENGVCVATSQSTTQGAQGRSASITAATDYVAINSSGTLPTASGNNAIAMGQNANAPGTNSVALGINASSSTGGDVALGANTIADGNANSAISMGANAQAVGKSSVALGDSAKVGVYDATSPTYVDYGVSVGGTSAVTAANGTAIGYGAKANAAGSVALGSGSIANAANTVSVGTTAAQRKIVNMAAGSSSTDAVNIGQLTPVVNALGGGAAINATTGAVTGPTYTLANGGTQTTVGGALSALDTAVSGKVDNTYLQISNSGTAATRSGLYSVAMGGTSSATAQGAVALGGSANAASNFAVALGYGAQVGAGATSSTALGNGATVAENIADAVALGHNAVADRANSVSVGSSSLQRQITNLAAGTQATDAVNVQQLQDATQYAAFKPGAYATDAPAVASGTSSTALGMNAQATSNGSIAIGGNSQAGGDSISNAMAVGTVAKATGASTVALGVASNALAQNATGMGANASAENINSTALGQGASAVADNSVALGQGSQSDRANTVSVGKSTALRQIVNVGAGTQDNDAVNVSQLSPVVAALGGNASIDANTGAVTGPTYTVNGQSVHSIGDAITNIDGRVVHNESAISDLQGQIGDGTVGLVQQDAATGNITVAAATNGSTVDFTGTDGARKLAGVAAGSQMTDAVNVSQLSTVVDALGGNASIDPNTGAITGPTYTVNGQSVHSVGDAVTNIDGRVTTNEGSISKLQDQISDGTVGLVQQDAATGNITVAAATNGSTVDFTGTDGARKLAGVAAGSQMTDAVNVSQLSTVVDALGGNASIDPNTGAVTGPTYTVNGQSVHSVGDAVTNIDGRVTTNEGSISKLQDQISDGTVGLVQQDAATGNITVAASTGGNSVNVGGVDGPRTLTGVANGHADSDAVTIAQLKATGLIDYTGKELGALVYDDLTLGTATLGGTNGTLIDNLLAGQIAAGSMQAVNGGQLFDLQQNFQGQFDIINNQYGLLSNQFNNLNDRVIGIEQGIDDGTIGGPGNGSGGPGSGEGSTVVGEGASADGSSSTAIGNGSNASGDNSSAIGQGSVASGSNGTAVGQGSSATGDNSTAIGQGSVASGSNSTATGQNSSATGSNSTANGQGSNASGSNSTAVGQDSTASGSNSTALGQGSTASGNNSVALGQGSVADRDNTVSVGSPGNERQITNVAAGTERTDAANWGQVQDAVGGVQDWANQKFNHLDRRINRIGAMSAAYGQMAFSAQGLQTNNKVGVGVGAQNGQSAIAVGYSRQIKPNLNVSFGGSASGSDVSVGAGMSLGW